VIDILAEIESWAAKAPDTLAHVARGGRLTYADLAARSDALACHLHANVERGKPVVVHGHKEPAMLVAFLACIKAGNPYVPVDAHVPAARLAKIVAHARVGAVLAPGVELDAVVARAGRERPPASARMRPDETVYIMYTSGSTGDPKGVQITLANLAGFVAWARQAHHIGTQRRFLNQAPFSFDLSVMDLYLALTTGGTLYSVDREMIENPLELRTMLAAADVHVWVSTPSFAEMCLADRQFSASRLPSLRSFLFCGETLAHATVRSLHARFAGAHVYNLYGPTEATVAVTSILVDRVLLETFPTIPLGAPRPDTQLLVVGPDQRPLPSGERGEIVIDGPCVSPGYLHAPELTARAFDGLRYRTGDAGRYDGDALLFDGRIDFQIKLDGHRIELEDVARNLEALPAVERAVVLAVERDGRCEALAAFVVARGGAAETSTSELRAQLGTRVPAYMIPRDIVYRAALPMTANGKIDRARLAAEVPQCGTSTRRTVS
jgi:D-alanine--poly(phosphoribitol) ligase subunit 1